VSLARRTLASLANPAYRLFFVGNVLSMLGFWIRLVVQGWLVYALEPDRLLLGAVTAISFLPFVLLSPMGGVLGDRVDRRRLLMSLPLVSVVANVALGVLVLTGTVTVVWIILLAALIGCARAVEIPVRNAFVRDVVGMADLRNAIALNAAGFNVARVLGPALGAGLLALLGMGPCFFVAAALTGSMLPALAAIRVPRRTIAPASGNAWRQLAEGLGHVRRHRRTRTVIQLFAISLLLTWTYQTLLVPFAKDRLGMGVEAYTLLASVVGSGALLGALWVAARASSGAQPVRRHVVFGLVWTGSACVFLLGFVAEVWLALPLLFLAGFCQLGFMATANGMVQESVPDELRARVMGLWTFTFGLCFPLGSLLMGGVAQAFDIRTAWSGASVVMVVLSLVVYLRMPRRSAAEIEQAAERAPKTTEEGPAVTDPVG